MYTNPIHINKSNKFDNYIVTLVVRVFEGKQTIDSFQDIQELCNQNKIGFVGREYDSRNYEEDCEYITRLPAFHIYDGKYNKWVGTFYEGQNPIEMIETYNNNSQRSILKLLLKMLGY